jgi:hypothetical protein
VITHAISGELYDELAHGTALDDGTSDVATWGYGSTRDVDIAVHRMVRAATSRKVGFGRRLTMTGSLDAWQAIAAYARDRGEMELQLDGDFSPGMGRRLLKQAERIDALVTTHTTKENA